MYPLDIDEEEVKNKVAQDFFAKFDTTQRFKNIDFVIAPKKQITKEKTYFLWAEAKKGNKSDIIKSFIQLILTIGKARLQECEIPPLFLGAFDCEKIAFLEFGKVAHIFSQNDFNWSVTPSNHDSKEFNQLKSLIGDILASQKLLFHFKDDNAELKDFIKANFTHAHANIDKIQITKNNFINIYKKWRTAVMPSIALDWESAKKHGILDGDFYLADLLSQSHKTLIDKLFVILQDRHYELLRGKNELGLFTSQKAEFRDERKAYDAFWQIYERPPKEEFWDFIISRRDLLVTDDIRERKGAFFTPQIWVQKAQEYLAQSLGENWQEEYYIWDCAAGTGNLLSGLHNKYRIFASTLDKADVDVMKERIQNGANLLDANIFQFDFLNDEFFDKTVKGGILYSKLPKKLQEIIKNEPHKLVIFINPPYKEAPTTKTVTKTGKNATSVANTTKIYEKYKEDYTGDPLREVFVQFFVRIYEEIPNCILGSFSTLKYTNSTKFVKFRQNFQAKFLKGFIVPAHTFDNVDGNFPIGFLVWNLGDKQKIEKCRVDIFDKNNKRIGKKNFYANEQTTNHWIKEFKDNKRENELCAICTKGTDFQNNNFCNINFWDRIKGVGNAKGITKFSVNKYNLIPVCIYFAVRHAIPHTWINHNDQFLYPNDKWQKDTEFQNDCLAFMLFHNKNHIKASISPSRAEGDKGGWYSGHSEYINHFIPFSESQVGAKEAFKSDFMVRFINGKLGKEDTAQSLRASKASAASAYEGEAQSKIHKNNIDCHDFAPAKSRNDNICLLIKKKSKQIRKALSPQSH